MSHALTPPVPTLDFATDVPDRTAWQENSLSKLFFSSRNVAALQHGIRYGVYKRSSGRFVVDEQPERDLRVIMRSIFLTHAVNLPYGIIDQVRSLNARVLDFAIPNVLSGAEAHRRYINEITTRRTILPHARDVSSKGERTLNLLPR